MTDFKLIDTYAIQIKSLCAFAYKLGYTHTRKWQFVSIQPYGLTTRKGVKGCNTISFNTMVMLHNYKIEYLYRFLRERGVNIYDMNQILSTKIVKDVYLQRSKKGVVSCHKHLVQFVHPAYEELFLLLRSVI